MVIGPRKLILLVATLTGTGAAFGQDYSGGIPPNAIPPGYATPLQNYYSQSGQQSIRSELLPRDTQGPERLQQPTPVRGHDLAGVPDYATNTRPDAATIGIRLDTSYVFLREISGGWYSNEHQSVGGGGVTILPFQNPGFILGFRGLANHIDNQSLIPDVGGFSFDVYAGTRYKHSYIKWGAFWDNQASDGKVGGSFNLMSDVPVIGNIVFESAFGFGYGPDRVGGPIGPFLLTQRIEKQQYDIQIKVGKYLTEDLQVGFIGRYLSFRYAEDEGNAGLYMNYLLGRARVGLEITGGDEGLRGFATLGIAFGAKPSEHPRDLNYGGIDTVEWVTRAPDRDITLAHRETFTGTPPVFP